MYINKKVLKESGIDKKKCDIRNRKTVKGQKISNAHKIL